MEGFRMLTPPATVLKAAAAYFALVFLAGFALGTLRVLVIAPRVGETLAVFLEAPVILAASWLASRGCAGRLRVRARGPDRLAMGGVAFALLMAAELALSVLVFGRSVTDYLSAWRTLAGAAGLLAQIGFALIPFVQLRWDRAAAR
jgi:hypothetical protein